MSVDCHPRVARSRRVLITAAATIILAACSSDAAGSEHIVISKYAGDNQTVVGGLQVPIAPAVRVTSNDQPAAGDTVTFAIADPVPGPGGAMLTGAVQVTGADGVATVGGWIPGTAGGHFLMARIIGSSATPVTFDATAIQYGLVVNAVAGNGQSAPAGSAVPIAPAVKVQIATATMGLVPLVDTTVTFTVGSGGGSVTGGVTKTDANGMARVGSWNLGPTAGGSIHYLSESARSAMCRSRSPRPAHHSDGRLWARLLTPGEQNMKTRRVSQAALALIVAVSLAGCRGAAVPSGPGSTATMTILAGDGQTGLTDDTVSVHPAVMVTDPAGQPVPGVKVTFTPGFKSGKISIDTATTGADGIATAGAWTLGFVGANSLSAGAPGVDDSPVYFNATAMDLLVLSYANGFNQTAPAGTAIAIPLAVQVMGAFTAAPIVGATVTFAVTDGGGSITGATTTTNAQGIATVGSWTLGPVPGPNHLTATVTWPGVWSLTMAATGTP